MPVIISFFGAEADLADVPITDERDGPEAKELNARIEAVCAFARANVYDGITSPLETPRPAQDGSGIRIGPLTLMFIHFRSKAGLFRQLTIAMNVPDVDMLPPPTHCAVIAKMFGFQGEIFKDYDAIAPVECTCGDPDCHSIAVACVQPIEEHA